MPDGDIVHIIYVKMKNKHNTMTSASSVKTYMKEVKNLDKQIFKCDNNARDSIWTQNYTLAEITGILYRIYNLWCKRQKYKKIRACIVYLRKTGLGYTGNQSEVFRVGVRL